MDPVVLAGQTSVSTQFTICIPTYNSEDTCERAIRSALEQTFGDYEVVIVDDGSSDGTWPIVSRYTGLQRVRVARNPRNLGVTASWQRCLVMARGNYVAFVHHDDYACPTLLADAWAVLQRHPSVGMIAFDSDAVRNGKYGLTPATEYFRYLYSHVSIPAPSGVIYRKTEGLSYDPEMGYSPETSVYLALASAGWDAFHSSKVNVRRPMRTQSLTARSRYSWTPFGDAYHIISGWRNHAWVTSADRGRAVSVILRRVVERIVVATLERRPNNLLRMQLDVLSKPARLGLGSWQLLVLLMALLPWEVSHAVRMILARLVRPGIRRA